MKKKENKAKMLINIRSEINEVDSQLIELLSRRRKLSLEISEVKYLAQKPIREKKREKEVLKKIITLSKKKKLDPLFASRIFQEIIYDSVKLQQKYANSGVIQHTKRTDIKIAIQGIKGSYSNMAAKKYFKVPDSELIINSKNRFEEVVEAVENGEAEFAVIPIENTTSGGINEVYDLLLHTALSIIGEEIYRVNHCLAATKKVPLKKIKKVYAHYQAAAQCSKFLAAIPECPIEFHSDTAMSFRQLAEEGNPYYAAIASEEAAKIYGLKVLKSNIANQNKNFTRFLIAGRNPVQPDKKTVCKTSLVMSTPHKAGALVDALSVFKKKNINLTKLESRPVTGKPWEQMFYLDFIGNLGDPEIKKVLNVLSQHTSYLKILGCYPACDLS